MAEQQDKGQILEQMNRGYVAFEALLASLSTEQLTTPGVNGNWSIKDNIAHLSQWHKRTIDLLQAVKEGRSLPHLTASMSEEEINEMFYQQNHARSLQDVEAEFRSTFQQFVESIIALSNEELNKPQDWLEHRPIVLWIAGNSYEHYEEHTAIIETWLSSQS